MQISVLVFWPLILIIITAIIGAAWFSFASYKKRDDRNLKGNPVYNAPVQTEASILNTRVCPNCNTPLGDGISYCMMCGTKVK